MKKLLVFVTFVSLVICSGCKVIINPVADMVIKDSNSNIIVNNIGSYDFGNITVNSSDTEKFTIYNLGKKTLELTGSPIVEISGSDSVFFQIDTESTTSLQKNETTSFEISFTPTELREFSIIVSISNNLENHNPYTFEITGKGVAPGIQVRQNTTIIQSITGVYEFEKVMVGETSSEVTFTIENIGTSLLKLTGSPKIQISGNDSTMFIVDQTSIADELESNKTTEFTIIFRPLTIGSKYATISIENSDINKTPYTFTVFGSVITSSDINVQDVLSNDIPNGTGSFDFGEISLRFSLEKSFLIQNLGNGDLVLTGSPLIEITGTDASCFTVTLEPLSNISPGYNSTFKIEFTPIEGKDCSANVSITSNDSDENPYTFEIKGKGLAPSMTVLDPESKVIPSGSGIHNFEITYVNSSKSETFTIQNEGPGNLLLYGSPLIEITGADASAFSVTVQPSSTISSNSETTFEIEFHPTIYQTHTVTVSIVNNDPNVNPYTFTIKAQSIISPYLWTKRMGGIENDIGNSVITDSKGNVYVTGEFSGTVNFGKDFGSTDYKTSYALEDIFVTKINSNGSYSWTKRIGGTSLDKGNSITVDKNDNIFVTGVFTQTINFGADFGSNDFKSPVGSSDVFILKINANGTYGWTKQIGGSGSENGTAITTDTSGNIFITGNYGRNGGSVNFAADFGSNDYRTSVGQGDVFITKINANCTYGYTKTFGSTYDESGQAITTDSYGNVFVTGFFVGQTDFGADFGVSDIKQGCGGTNTFITRINANATYGWTRKICGMSDEKGLGIAICLPNTLFIAGIFGYGSSSVDFSADFPSAISDVKTSKGYQDMFVTSMSTNGSYYWTKQFGGSSEESCNAIKADIFGNIYITGWFHDTIDFGYDFNVKDEKTSYGYGDIFVTKFTFSGTYQWTKQIGGVGGDSGNALAVDDYGNLYITGGFGRNTGGTVNFGKDFGINDPKTSAGVEDIFITKIYVK